MFGFLARSAKMDTALVKALHCSLAIIQFDPAGKILDANENFCKAMGYSLEEIRGKHHSLFVDADEARSAGAPHSSQLKQLRSNRPPSV